MTQSAGLSSGGVDESVAAAYCAVQHRKAAPPISTPITKIMTMTAESPGMS
jgi:hypothetical protein